MFKSHSWIDIVVFLILAFVAGWLGWDWIARGLVSTFFFYSGLEVERWNAKRSKFKINDEIVGYKITEIVENKDGISLFVEDLFPNEDI